MTSIIYNFETSKLPIGFVEIQNLIIIAIIIGISLFTLRKNPSPGILNRNTTSQLRGIAILMVVLGHLWVHVSKTRPILVMSGDGVAFFLFLSGFGIRASLDKSTNGLKSFAVKRLRRVMVPYWIATVGILILDYFVLNIIYPAKQIVLTLLGVNIWGVMHHFDYVRWYITFLFFWYIVAYLSGQIRNTLLCSSIPLVIAFFIFLTDYYLLHFDWYQFLAFPIGWFVYAYRKSIELWFRKNIRKAFYLLFIVLVSSFLYKLLFQKAFILFIPGVMAHLLIDVVSVLFTISIIGLLSINSISSSIFLEKIGEYSYEIFLLHGVFLVRYNPFLGKGPAFVMFFLLLSFVTLMAVIMKHITNKINEKWMVSGVI